MEHLGTALEIAGLVLLGAKAITTQTPSRHDDKYVDLGLRIINMLALNIGRDKNADDRV